MEKHLLQCSCLGCISVHTLQEAYIYIYIYIRYKTGILLLHVIVAQQPVRGHLFGQIFRGKSAKLSKELKLFVIYYCFYTGMSIQDSVKSVLVFMFNRCTYCIQNLCATSSFIISAEVHVFHSLHQYSALGITIEV